jgi:hypothetical protein
VLQHDRIFFGTAEAVPSRKTIRYSPFTIRYRFGFNWRVVLQHDRIFFGTAEAVPSRKTIRYSPPFQPSKSLVLSLPILKPRT